jgi:hypothetical protein
VIFHHDIWYNAPITALTTLSVYKGRPSASQMEVSVSPHDHDEVPLAHLQRPGNPPYLRKKGTS